MDWIKEPSNIGLQPRGCGTNICWSRDDNSNCQADYCVVRVCLTRFCFKNY